MLDGQHDAEGADDGYQGFVLYGAQKSPFDDQAEGPDYHRREEQTQPEVAGGFDNIPADHCTQHVQGPMGHVDDVEEAENHIQAQGDQGHDQAPDYPVDQGNGDVGKHAVFDLLRWSLDAGGTVPA